MKGKLGSKNLLIGRPGLAQAQKHHPVSPTTANLVILGGGVLLGLAAYAYRESPLGNVVLNAAGSVAGVALVFFLNATLFQKTSPAH